MLNAKLVVVGGDAKKAEVHLKLPTIIGRGKEAGLTVPHALVSRRHTEIFEREGQLFVRDLGSLNGTYVNNTRIETEQPLEPNQLLTLGNITFRAVYEVESHATADVAAYEETVSIEEEKTVNATVRDVLQIQSAGDNQQISSISDVMSFDETVPVESISSQNQRVDAAQPSSRNPKQNNVGQQPPAEPKASAEASAQQQPEPDHFHEADRVRNPAGDTDKSFVDGTTYDGTESGSSVFSFDTDEIDDAKKSVSASALDDLPAGQSAVSFLGNFDSGEDQTPVSHLDPVKIDLGEEENAAKIEVDSNLGSFLKKLPR